MILLLVGGDILLYNSNVVEGSSAEARVLGSQSKTVRILYCQVKPYIVIIVYEYPSRITCSVAECFQRRTLLLFKSIFYFHISLMFSIFLEGHFEFDPIGDDVTWTNWGNNQPNNYDPSTEADADCVSIIAGGLWWDFSCSREFRFICERVDDDDTPTVAPTTTVEQSGGSRVHVTGQFIDRTEVALQCCFCSAFLSCCLKSGNLVVVTVVEVVVDVVVKGQKSTVWCYGRDRVYKKYQLPKLIIYLTLAVYRKNMFRIYSPSKVHGLHRFSLVFCCCCHLVSCQVDGAEITLQCNCCCCCCCCYCCHLIPCLVDVVEIALQCCCYCFCF